MFREHLTCSFSLRFIMVMFYPPHCYICCHDCIQLWRFRMQPLTPWLEALRPGWFVDSHGCLESELFDLDSAPAHPMGTNSVSWSDSKTKSNPFWPSGPTKSKTFPPRIAAPKVVESKIWRLSMFFLCATIGQNHRVSDAVKTSINEVTHEKVVRVGAVAPYLSKSRIKMDQTQKQSQSAIDETLFCLEQLHQIVELAMDVPANLGYTQQPWTN